MKKFGNIKGISVSNILIIMNLAIGSKSKISQIPMYLQGCPRLMLTPLLFKGLNNIVLELRVTTF